MSFVTEEIEGNEESTYSCRETNLKAQTTTSPNDARWCNHGNQSHWFLPDPTMLINLNALLNKAIASTSQVWTSTILKWSHFISVLKRFLNIQSFYSVNEFLDYECWRCFVRKYCKCCVFVSTFSLFVIIFMTSDCICNHAWFVLWLVLYPNAIWRFDGSLECICKYVKIILSMFPSMASCAYQISWNSTNQYKSY
jgi:hypothetical protein